MKALLAPFCRLFATAVSAADYKTGKKPGMGDAGYRLRAAKVEPCIEKKSKR